MVRLAPEAAALFVLAQERGGAVPGALGAHRHDARRVLRRGAGNGVHGAARAVEAWRTWAYNRNAQSTGTLFSMTRISRGGKQARLTCT